MNENAAPTHLPHQHTRIQTHTPAVAGPAHVQGADADGVAGGHEPARGLVAHDKRKHAVKHPLVHHLSAKLFEKVRNHLGEIQKGGRGD